MTLPAVIQVSKRLSTQCTGSTGYEGTKTMRGKVVRYFEDKGYGFLMDETNKQSYFLHFSEVQDEDPIQVGDTFSFQAMQTQRGLQAVNCTRIPE